MEEPRHRRTSTAFLLAQVGSWAGEQFGDRISPRGLSRSQAGLLWIVDGNPEASQQQLAELLRVTPSRIVALLDDLEKRDLVERRRSTKDRRVFTVELTDTGRQTLRAISKIARAHNDDVCAPLDDAEEEQLHDLLQRIAHHAGLTERVHPGHRDT